MMTLFGGIAKAPLAIMIMVSEMTGNYSLLIPSMVSVVIAYFLTGNSYIYESQVGSRSDSPAHRTEYSVPIMDKIQVREAMVKNPLTVSPEMLISDAVALMRSNKIDGAPVLRAGRLVGVITNLDIARLSEQDWPKLQVQDKMTKELVVGHADETLYDALNRMTRNNISHLPVVEHGRPDRMIGFLAVHDIADIYGLQKKSAARGEG
jgi:CIC family chloride channel protein